MTIKDDIMRMKPLDGGLKIKAGSIINLRPGSYHIMFMKLIKNIKAKNNHIISLNFKKSGVVSINIPVYKRFLKLIMMIFCFHGNGHKWNKLHLDY